jgi:hypothetical protein
VSVVERADAAIILVSPGWETILAGVTMDRSSRLERSWYDNVLFTARPRCGRGRPPRLSRRRAARSSRWLPGEAGTGRSLVALISLALSAGIVAGFAIELSRAL